MKTIFKIILSAVLVITSFEVVNAQPNARDTIWIKECFLPILRKVESRYLERGGYHSQLGALKDLDWNAKWVHSQASLNLVRGSRDRQNDSLDLYDYNLQTTKKVLIKLIQRSTKSESEAVKNIIDFISKVDNEELNQSDYGKMVDKTIFNRDGTKLDKRGIKLSLNVLSMLLRTEIEYDIVSAISNSIYILDTEDVSIGGGASCGGLVYKRMELSQSDISLLTLKGMRVIIEEGLSTIEKFENWERDKRELFMITFMSARYNNHLAAQPNVSVTWDPFASVYRKNIELTNKEIKNDLYEYLSLVFNVDESMIERYVNVDALVNIFSLWNVEKSGVMILPIPQDYDKRGDIPDYVNVDALFAQIKESYPELTEVKLSDYKEYVYKNFKSSKKSKVKITSSFYDCLNEYIESIPRLSRPNFDEKEFTIPTRSLVGFYEPYFEGITGNNQPINVNLKQEKDSLIVEISDTYSKLAEVQKEYEKNAKNEENLSMDEMNKQNKIKAFFSEMDETVSGQAKILSIVLPLLFEDKNQLIDYFSYYKEGNKKYINSQIKENRKNALRDFDDNYSPSADTLISQLMFLNPVFKKSIYKFKTANSDLVEAFGDELEKTSEEFQNTLIKLSKLQAGSIKLMVDRFNERNANVGNRFKNVSEYFNNRFDSKKKNEGIMQDRFNGSTYYIVNRDRSNIISGEATFFWKNLNEAEIVSTINPAGGRPVTINLKGKISKNSNPNYSADWPYVFVIDTPVGSEGDKFYIRFEDFKCYSNIKFEGSGRSDNIFLSFGIIL
jgi:hypothetical protein